MIAREERTRQHHMSAISDIARENSLKILGVTLICNLSASDHTRGEKPRLYIA